MIQLLVVDGDCFAATGLREFLASIPDFELGEMMCSGQEMLAQTHSPDVMVVGYPLPDMSLPQFIEAIAARHWPTRILLKGGVRRFGTGSQLIKSWRARLFFAR